MQTALTSKPLNPEIKSGLLKHLYIAATVANERPVIAQFEAAVASHDASIEDALVEAMQLYVAAHPPTAE